MAVTLRDRTFKEPKELGEVYDAVESLVALALGAGTTAEKLGKLTGELPKLITAGEGLGKIKEEIQDDAVYECTGAFTGRLTKNVKNALKKPDPAPADAPAAPAP